MNRHNHLDNVKGQDSNYTTTDHQTDQCNKAKRGREPLRPEGAGEGEPGREDRPPAPGRRGRSYRNSTEIVKRSAESPSKDSQPRNDTSQDTEKTSFTDSKSEEEQTKTSKPNGYILSFAKLPRSAAKYIDDILDGYSYLTDHDRHLFKHILVSGSTWTDDGEIGWVPVAWKLLDYQLPNANPRRLLEAGLVDRTDSYTKGLESYEYRVIDAVRGKFTQLLREPETHTWVNIFTGRTTRRKADPSVYDKHRNRYPELIAKAIKVIDRGYFNRAAIEKHISRLEAQRDARRREFREIQEAYDKDSEAYDEGKTAYREAEGRFQNDVMCLKTLEAQKPEHMFGNIFTYVMAYVPTMSGRLTYHGGGLRGGGLQSCTREMKLAAYTGIQNLHNYDIKASQPTILREELRNAGLPTSWIEDYLANSDAKYDYADRAGLSVDTWKKVLMAVIMGAGLDRRAKKESGEEGFGFAVFDQIRKEVGIDHVYSVMDQVERIIGPLKEVLTEWHNYLIEKWLPEIQYPARGGLYVKNATGKSLCISKIPKRDRKRKLSAFILQGEEAAFIHRLTALAVEYEFDPIANEHDGLVTIGEIPEEAIIAVRDDLSMPYIRLVEKPFV